MSTVTEPIARDNPETLAPPMEAWRRSWRAFAADMGTNELEALAAGLRADDPAIIQGATVQPPPLQCVADWPVQAADAVAYAAWKGCDISTVAEVEEAFAWACQHADERLGERAGCRWYLNWYDDTPREEMRRELGWEVDFELLRRSKKSPPAPIGGAA